MDRFKKKTTYFNWVTLDEIRHYGLLLHLKLVQQLHREMVAGEMRTAPCDAAVWLESERRSIPNNTRVPRCGSCAPHYVHLELNLQETYQQEKKEHSPVFVEETPLDDLHTLIVNSALTPLS